MGLSKILGCCRCDDVRRVFDGVRPAQPCFYCAWQVVMMSEGMRLCEVVAVEKVILRNVVGYFDPRM